MLNQTDINENMRALLIDWLVDVHFKFKLSPETLFMTVNLIDRYLSKIIISRKIFQLIGVSALFIACKYEEVYVPEVNEFSRITEKTYSVKEILDMEGHILSVLQFDLTFTSSHRFLERYSYLSNFDGKSFRLARFLLEIALIEYKMVKYPPSMLAASAIYLTKKINKLPEPWSKLMAYHSNYLQKDLFECSTDLLQIWRNSERTSLNAVTRKYSFQNSKDNSRFGTQ